MLKQLPDEAVWPGLRGLPAVTRWLPTAAPIDVTSHRGHLALHVQNPLPSGQLQNVLCVLDTAAPVENQSNPDTDIALLLRTASSSSNEDVLLSLHASPIVSVRFEEMDRQLYLLILERNGSLTVWQWLAQHSSWRKTGTVALPR